MKVNNYQLSFRRYDQSTINVMHSCGLQLHISRLTNRLCAIVSSEERDRLIAELNEKGYFPELSEIFENQTA